MTVKEKEKKSDIELLSERYQKELIANAEIAFLGHKVSYDMTKRQLTLHQYKPLKTKVDPIDIVFSIRLDLETFPGYTISQCVDAPPKAIPDKFVITIVRQYMNNINYSARVQHKLGNPAATEFDWKKIRQRLQEELPRRYQELYASYQRKLKADSSKAEFNDVCSVLGVEPSDDYYGTKIGGIVSIKRQDCGVEVRMDELFEPAEAIRLVQAILKLKPKIKDKKK